MFNTLNCVHLGIKGFSLPNQIALAKKTGFRGLSFDLGTAVEIANADGVDTVQALFNDAGIRP